MQQFARTAEISTRDGVLFLTYRVVLAYGKLQEHQSMFHYEEILWENDWLLRFIARAAETIWMFIAVARISI